MATHSSILAWKIPWTEEPGGLQSTGSKRVGHDWATSLTHSCLTSLYSRNQHNIMKQLTVSQFNCSVMFDSLWPRRLQDDRPPCPSPTPRAYSNSCPLSWWCHSTISSSVCPFSSCLHSFPASGSLQMSQLFISGGQSIRVSASTSVLPLNTQDWSPLGWTCWISLQSKRLSSVFSNTTVQKHQFFVTKLSSHSNSHIHTWPLKKPYPWLDGPLLAKQCLCFLLCYLGWS